MNTTKRAHIYMFFLTLYMLVGQVLIGMYLRSTNTRLSLTQSSLISQYLLIFIPAIIYFIVTKSNVVDTLHLKKVSPLDLLIAFGIAVFLIPLVMLINVLSQFFSHNYLQDYVGDIMNMNYFLLVFLIAVTPALVEELTFRGIILRNYKNQTVLVTCLINGLLFGIFHGNLNQFMYAMVLGAVFAYILHVTGSIIPGMIMHFTINFSTVSYQRLIGFYYNVVLNDPTAMDAAMNAEMTTGTLVIAAGAILFVVLCTLPLAGLLIYALSKRHNKPNLLKNGHISGVVLGDITEAEVDHEEKAFNPTLIFIFAYFIGYVAIFEFILPMIQG